MDVSSPSHHVGSTTLADDAEMEFEHEVERIQKTVGIQLVGLEGLTSSLVKKFRKAEAQTSTLRAENTDLEDKNAALASQLGRAQEEIRTLLIKVEQLHNVEQQLEDVKKTVVATELAVKKTEAERDALASEKDAIDSELATVKVRLDTISAELDEERENNEKEKSRLGQEVEDRSLALASITTERDTAAKDKADIEQLLKSKDAEILELGDRVTFLTTQAEKRKEEVDLEILQLTDQKDKALADRDNASRDLTVLQTDHDSNMEAKTKLESEVAALTNAKEQLADKIELFENELEEKKASYVQVEGERDELKKDLEQKAGEIAEVTATIAALTTERDHLIKTRGELETTLEDTKKELETKSNELEEKNTTVVATERSLGDTKKVLDDKDVELEEKKQAYMALEGEKNLLQGEMAQLEKDYAQARTFEKRAHELEEDGKKLRQTIAALEAEKLILLEDHQKELHEQMIKYQQEHALQTAQLRKELDDVVDRHATIQPDQETPAEGITDDVEPVAMRSLPADETLAAPVPGDSVDGVVDAHVTDSSYDRASALVAPTTVPSDPAPVYEEDIDEIKPAGGDTLVMVRDEMEDNDDDEEEEDNDDDDDDEEDNDDDDDLEDNDDNDDDLGGKNVILEDNQDGRYDDSYDGGATKGSEGVMDSGPGEGNTAAIVSEEVVEEMVVDDVRDGDDVLEEVDEEVPVPAEEAADRRLALGGVKATEEDTGEAVVAGSGDGDAKETVGDKVADVADDVKTGAKDAGAAAGEKAHQVVNSAGDTAKDATDKAKDTANLASDKLKDTVNIAGDKTKGVTSGTKGAATDAGTAVKNAVAAGAATSRGMADAGAKKSGGILQRVLCCTGGEPQVEARAS